MCEFDPLYEAKRWLFWHSTIGIHVPNLYELEREAEIERLEREYQPGLMERFTEKLVRALKKELHELCEAKKLSPKQHTIHIEMIRAYANRLIYYREHHL